MGVIYHRFQTSRLDLKKLLEVQQLTAKTAENTSVEFVCIHLLAEQYQESATAFKQPVWALEKTMRGKEFKGWIPIPAFENCLEW